jgi:hypothetical protein
LLDFEKNIHAENVTKEFGVVSPEFLCRFQLERLLEFDGCRKAILFIYKAYIQFNRTQVYSATMIVEGLVKLQNLRAEVLDYVSPEIGVTKAKASIL